MLASTGNQERTLIYLSISFLSWTLLVANYGQGTNATNILLLSLAFRDIFPAPKYKAHSIRKCWIWALESSSLRAWVGRRVMEERWRSITIKYHQESQKQLLLCLHSCPNEHSWRPLVDCSRAQYLFRPLGGERGVCVCPCGRCREQGEKLAWHCTSWKRSQVQRDGQSILTWGT